MNKRDNNLIYVVEDDPEIVRLIAESLERFDFQYELFRYGRDLLQRIQVQAPNLCILDLGLPDMDGMQVLHELRDKHRFGLLIVTARTETPDRVLGLELGADDYMVKPFEPRELIARVRSVLRRYFPAASKEATVTAKVASFAGWRFNLGTNQLVSPDGAEENLSVADARLLTKLLENPNIILSREQLLLGRDEDVLDRSIDLRISRLRRRFENHEPKTKLIKTVYGAGYLFSTLVTWN